MDRPVQSVYTPAPVSYLVYLPRLGEVVFGGCAVGERVRTDKPAPCPRFQVPSASPNRASWELAELQSPSWEGRRKGRSSGEREVSTRATSSGEFWGRVDIVDIRVDIRISKNPDIQIMASNAGNFWENIEGFGLFLYFHGIIFVVNYKMNIISSHKMYIISPSVTRAAIRG